MEQLMKRYISLYREAGLTTHVYELLGIIGQIKPLAARLMLSETDAKKREILELIANKNYTVVNGINCDVPLAKFITLFENSNNVNGTRTRLQIAESALVSYLDFFESYLR